jgi:hypothetical protein
VWGTGSSYRNKDAKENSGSKASKRKQDGIHRIDTGLSKLQRDSLSMKNKSRHFWFSNLREREAIEACERQFFFSEYDLWMQITPVRCLWTS